MGVWLGGVLWVIWICSFVSVFIFVRVFMICIGGGLVFERNIVL